MYIADDYGGRAAAAPSASPSPPSASGYVTFLEAGMYGSGAPSLGTRESAELFLAISGASLDGTGLLVPFKPSPVCAPKTWPPSSITRPTAR